MRSFSTSFATSRLDPLGCAASVSTPLILIRSQACAVPVRPARSDLDGNDCTKAAIRELACGLLA